MRCKVVISLKLEAEGRKSPTDLLNAIKALPYNVEIVEGVGQRAITVILSDDASLLATKAIDFADVEPYGELELI